MLPDLIKSMRPRQATKNLLVFGALVFIPGAIMDPGAFLRSVLAFIIFSFAASAGYIFNDIRDIQYDRTHPKKRFRPIASGKVSTMTAACMAIILLIHVAIGCAYLDLSPFRLPEPAQAIEGIKYGFTSSIAGYLLLTLVYSMWLRNVPLLDVIVLSIGFVLRAVAGALALKVIISPWLLLCTGLLALFLVLGKRRQELVRMSADSDESGSAAPSVAGRRSLSGYTVSLLDQLLLISASVNIMSYSLYTFTSATHEDNRLMLTIPFVIYGIFRYQYLVHKENSGESPEEVLLSDLPLRLCLFFWVLSVIVLFLIP